MSNYNRQVILDTETTGLEHRNGHRIIEIGCVELINRKPTGNNYQEYLNPQREIDQGAQEVHGIDNDFLLDKPLFIDICTDFLAYVEGAELVIHNADFDLGFLNAELELAQKNQQIEQICGVLDTLKLARKMYPGQRNDLDSLCKRYEIDNSQRIVHGALLDAEILADVYLALTGGQTDLKLEAAETEVEERFDGATGVDLKSLKLATVEVTDKEQRSHVQWLARLDAGVEGKCVWSKLTQSSS